ncbi:MAG: NUDIX domain-containing protein [Candidatus Saccharibacteria bacterium]
MRHTIRGIIIKDRKVLLVTGHGAGYYWTPGGGIEDGEMIEETLHREIMEELGVTISVFEPYYSYEYEDQKVENFLIEVDGDIQISNEITDIFWYSSNSGLKTSSGFICMVLPRLLLDGLID